MPGQKGESGKAPTPTASNSGAYGKSQNTFGDAETAHMQGFNSTDGSQAMRGGAIKNSDGGYGKGSKGGDY